MLNPELTNSVESPSVAPVSPAERAPARERGSLRDAAVRATLAASLAARHTLRQRVERTLPSPHGVRDDALEAAIAWLRLSHDTTGRNGSSKGYSLVRGWLPAYPETTGYVIGTLLDHGDAGDLARAVEMGDWEIAVQLGDGGVMLGSVETRPIRSVVFNTGMVVHGWVDLYEHGLGERFLDAALRAGEFLERNMRADGTWAAECEYSGIPHTYNSRVAWAMLRLARVSGRESLRDAACRQLDWVIAQQRPSGWFDNCAFKPGGEPSTHGVAYTLRGLLEAYELVGESAYLDAALRASEALIRKLEVLGRLPATYDESWNPTSGYECVTGTVQLGGVWLRLFQITADGRYLNAGLKAVEQAARRQYRGRVAAARGALPGSFPVYGRYAPMQFPNWATKFLADSLMLRETCLEGSR
jgi:uncharacterized protein YyaL (SSP411 family)